MSRINPTDAVDVSFERYVQTRKAAVQSHMQDGIPDYAYGADYQLRQKIRAIPGFYPLAKAISSTYVPRMIQQLQQGALLVGPGQFPDVYEMVSDCARRLGIGIPTVFVENSNVLNAYTYAYEDDSPVMVITSTLLARVTPGELRVVIGHECGHIHNNHGIYETAARILLNAAQIAVPGLRQIAALASVPLQLAFQTWSRAAEVTCDRAGVICSEDPQDAVSLMTKFIYSTAVGNREVNLDAILRQYDAIRSTPVRLLELSMDHPLPVRRIFAIREFAGSRILYGWRPEWKTPDQALTDKQELDARCEKYVSVTDSRKRRAAL